MSSCRATNAKRKAPRAHARAAGRAGRETRASDEQPTTRLDLTELRERAGLSQTEAAELLAQRTRRSAAAWQVSLSNYERGFVYPSETRLAVMLALYTESAVEQAAVGLELAKSLAAADALAGRRAVARYLRTAAAERER